MAQLRSSQRITIFQLEDIFIHNHNSPLSFMALKLRLRLWKENNWNRIWENSSEIENKSHNKLNKIKGSIITWELKDVLYTQKRKTPTKTEQSRASVELL